MSIVCLTSSQHHDHNPQYEWMDGRLDPYLETAARADLIAAALREAGYALTEAVPLDQTGWKVIQRVHADDYLAYLSTAYNDWTTAGGSGDGLTPCTYPPRRGSQRPQSPLALAGWYGYDGGGVIVPGTWQAVQGSAACALHGAALLMRDIPLVYALCRPPGHHAYREQFGGYCFLNNAAIAAERLRMEGRRVALLDIDYHHGNGTQELFYDTDSVLFLSIHGDPRRAYPYFAGHADERGAGAGAGYTLNYPLEAGVDDQRYMQVLDQACDEITQFCPDALIVSAGFDTYVDDPLGDFAVTTAGFGEIGHRIGDLGLLTLVVQEGGYAIEALGQNVVALLDGLKRADSG